MGVDGTLIRLGKYPSRGDLDPGLEQKMFTCRKWYAALNVMAVGDMDGLLRYIDVRWPGSGMYYVCKFSKKSKSKIPNDLCST